MHLYGDGRLVPYKMTPEKQERLISMLASGRYQKRQVAEALEVSKSTVTLWSKRLEDQIVVRYSHAHQQQIRFEADG